MATNVSLQFILLEMHEIKIIATNKWRIRLCQALKQLGRGPGVLPPPVAELGCLYEREGAESVPTTGIWKGRHFLHRQIISSNHVKWCNSKIDSTVSYSKLCFLLFPSLTAPMVRNLPLASRLNVLMAICIHLSLCQHCFKFNTRYL